MEIEITFDRVVALLGIALAIVLVVLDKAGKLKGPILFWLLVLAALMCIPLAIGNSWVKDTPWGILRVSKGLLMVSIVAMAYSILAIWVSSPSEDEANKPPPSPSQATFINVEVAQIDYGLPLITSKHAAELELRFKNGGAYPAQQFVSSLAMATTREGYPFGPALDDEVFSTLLPKLEAPIAEELRSNFSLDPGDSTSKRIGITFDEPTANNINSNKIFLYLLGFIEWTDGKGRKRKEFCYTVEPSGNQFRYHYASRHNQTVILK